MKDDDLRKKDAEQQRSNKGSPAMEEEDRKVQAAGTGSAEAQGTGIPRAGDHEMGVGGASGESDKGTGNERSGKTNNVRGNFGVGGQDLTRGGLPPS